MSKYIKIIKIYQNMMKSSNKIICPEESKNNNKVTFRTYSAKLVVKKHIKHFGLEGQSSLLQGVRWPWPLNFGPIFVPQIQFWIKINLAFMSWSNSLLKNPQNRNFYYLAFLAFKVRNSYFGGFSIKNYFNS